MGAAKKGWFSGDEGAQAMRFREEFPRVATT
jgi:hypothetical protein